MIDLSKIVPSLRVCRLLKDAGFPQDTIFFWSGYTDSSGERQWRIMHRWQKAFLPESCEFYAAPIIPEISMHKDRDCFMAILGEELAQ